jgi:hypothetical protein
MKLQTKALYNLLKLNALSDPSIAVEKWQVEDLRAVSIDDLFDKLNQLGISLDHERFIHFADETDSPEELSELLLADAGPRQHDHVYLLLFEIWRRLLPEKFSLSIFCDELDFRISQYDAGAQNSDELIQDALSNLDEILDENTDAGAKPAEIFETISSYLAHDLMGFIIDFISDLIDSGKQIYASELIEDFSHYAKEIIWFDFLRARLIALNDPVKANQLIRQLLEHDEALSVDFLLDVLRFQTGYGERQVFALAVKKLIHRLRTEEEFKELLELAAEYFRRRDREDLDRAVQNLLSKRKKTGGPIRASDPDVKAFQKLIP